MSFREQLASLVLSEVEGAASTRETVLTLGVFDGVHQGHCHLLRRLRQFALPSYLPGVVTFTNHPRNILRPGSGVRYIATPEEKVHLLKAQGIELVVSLEFTPELSRVRAGDFAALLVEHLKMRGLVVGPDFALGYNREGNINFLRQLGSEMGFWVEMVEPLFLDGILVKSRRIREAISQGNMEACARLLGRKFSLSGVVVKGDGRGRELGFPTANLAVAPQMILPGDGIYATWAIIDRVRHPSATSIGVRPTFGLTERLVEVYIMDFDADLYGQQIDVEFVGKLRDQETFLSVAALIEQIDRDIANARLALARA